VRGPNASENLEPDGRWVVLRTDQSQDTFYRYDRLLAYAARRDGKQLQLAQLRAGWVKVYVYSGKPSLARTASAAARGRRSRHFGRSWGYRKPAWPGELLRSGRMADGRRCGRATS
jgi:endonuclease YncB( thermonuclease family)